MSGAPLWRNPGSSLGLRCVWWSRAQLRAGVRANPYGQPNTSEAVAEYLRPCVRDVDGDGEVEPLGLTQGNWCAAFASAAMRACLLPGETAPHLYRAGVVEIVADAKASGLYHGVEDVRAGVWTPNVGDLCIWDRSDPGRPETSWWRHVNRLVGFTSPEQDHMVTIGGNEHRRVVETGAAPKALSHAKLLGFVSYYQTPQVVEQDPGERERDLRLIAAFVEEHRQSLGRGV